jgi:hypothetical protein
MMRGLKPRCSRDWRVSNPLSHNGKLNVGTSFLALNKNDEYSFMTKYRKFLSICTTLDRLDISFYLYEFI